MVLFRSGSQFAAAGIQFALNSSPWPALTSAKSPVPSCISLSCMHAFYCCLGGARYSYHKSLLVRFYLCIFLFVFFVFVVVFFLLCSGRVDDVCVNVCVCVRIAVRTAAERTELEMTANRTNCTRNGKECKSWCDEQWIKWWTTCALFECAFDFFAYIFFASSAFVFISVLFFSLFAVCNVFTLLVS